MTVYHNGDAKSITGKDFLLIPELTLQCVYVKIAREYFTSFKLKNTYTLRGGYMIKIRKNTYDQNKEKHTL